MRNAWFAWVVFCAFALTMGCREPSPNWNGTWKLNPSKSNFQGPIFTISIPADGEYSFDNGRSSFTLRCDGKDRAIGKNRTEACVKSSPTTLELTRKENGVKTNAFHWELSDEEQVFTSTATAFGPSGPVVTDKLVASRMSGSNGFAGKWRDTSYLQRHADMTLSLDSQTLHIAYPDGGQFIDAPLDGTDAPIHGPNAPTGVTYTARLDGRREILTVAKRDGKVLTQGLFELSADGRAITENWWEPDQPSNKGTFIYERQ